ncbi:MAG: PIN domain-containing protein [Dehalococcoidia bacterium]|nr:PIN domain-containing protein [Dehalococcoidia bacterium]
MAEPLRAIDANVLLRYLLNDVPEQAEKARRLIDSEQRIGLTVIALAEVAWKLAGPPYKRRRSEVAVKFIDLLARENVVGIGFDKDEAQFALTACTSETKAAGLGDALIAACARSAGIEEIYSFDQGFSLAGLITISPP